MTYPGLFSRYTLQGKDWIRRVEPEDRKAFVQIGLEETGHGQKGGRAVYMRRGREHMSKIGRIGAIATNSIKEWNQAVRDEVERELGVTFDF